MQTLDHPHDAAGSITGSDTLNLIGQYFPRTVQGTFTVGTDCPGTGSYADSLGNEISFVFTAVNDGDTLDVEKPDRTGRPVCHCTCARCCHSLARGRGVPAAILLLATGTGKV